MWAEQSSPRSELSAVESPIIADTPVVAQPPLLLKSMRTDASARGAMTQSGMMMANRPQTWRMRTAPSMSGSLDARTVLKIMEKLMTAIVRSVPCHLSKT